MIQYNTGDVLRAFSGKYDVLAHGCNCFCTMGAGIAKSIRSQYPQVYVHDLKTVKGDMSKLGTIDIVPVLNKKYIINAYTQYDYRRYDKAPADYAAIASCFGHISKYVKANGLSICIPKIGAGLAGGNWNIIEGIINTHFSDYPIDVYVL